MLRTHAVVEFGQPLQIVEQPLPVPTGDEVLVRTTYAGMCHSELHLWEGYFDFKKGADHDRVGPQRVTQAGLISPTMVK